MKESLNRCLDSDYKHSFDRVFDRIELASREPENYDLPTLKLRYMVDDYQDTYGTGISKSMELVSAFRATSI